MKNAEAVVFDFNGTLFFDYRENREDWDEVSLKYRGRKFEESEYNAMMGMTDRMCVRHMMGDPGLEECDAVSREKEEIYRTLVVRHGLAMEEDALTFMKMLKDDGIAVSIASSAPRENMDFYIDYLGLGRLMEKRFITAGRTDIPSKPDPAVFRLSLSALGVPGERAICFEDAPNGLKAALLTPFRKVYCISSPGFDDTEQRKMAPVIGWKYTLDNYREIISL